MTLYEMRKLVLNSRSDTLMAQRFREAFGLRPHKERKARTITREDWRRRKERKAVMECMAQKVGALDRGNEPS